ncbi:MAG: hypothetical protein EOL93_00575 [Epsilonproteobacteria bacterium]|nr:hypothetical protein [Campylobacterota bacterium]
MKGYKGFDKDLSCRGYKFELGKTFEEDVNPSTCNTGLHFCKMPLDVFGYYPPVPNAKYAEVEALGDIDESDDKVATNKLKIDSSISIGNMFKAHFKMVYENLTYSDTANTSGDEAHANTSGYRAHANTSGDEAHANTSGNYAHANTSGDEAVACSLGYQSKAKAVNGWIVIVDWQCNGEKYFIKDIHSAKVGKKIKNTIIKSDVWYWFEEGKLKSES